MNAILHVLQVLAPRPRQTVNRSATFARPNMDQFIMLSSLSTSRNEMGIDITFLLCVQVYLCHHVKGPFISKCLFGIFNSLEKRTKKFNFTAAMIPQVQLFSFVFWSIEDTKKTQQN